jgi:hypothetical protein
MSSCSASARRTTATGRRKSTRGESEAPQSSAAKSMPSAYIPTATAVGGRKSPVRHMVVKLLADLSSWDKKLRKTVLHWR